MTVAELIAELEKFPQDKIVTYTDSEWGLVEIRSLREADLEENKNKVVLDYYVK